MTRQEIGERKMRRIEARINERRNTNMKLYYHKTDGGAEYLTDRWTRNPDGSKEGVIENARYIMRIDGNLTKDAELIIVKEGGGK